MYDRATPTLQAAFDALAKCLKGELPRTRHRESGAKMGVEMYDAIVEKIKAVIKSPVTSEHQVVYILVQIRKVAERRANVSLGNTLRLYCDWVVHPWLDRKGAKEIVKVFDEFRSASIAPGGQRNARSEAQATVDRLLDFSELRAELVEFLTTIGASNVRDDWWERFAFHLAHVIEDCPVRANGNGTGRVCEVTVTIYPHENRLHVRWECTDDMNRQISVCESSIPVPLGFADL